MSWMLARGLCEDRCPSFRSQAIREIRIKGRLGPRSVFLRANGIDTRTFWEVLVAEIYGDGPPLRRGATVIDAGANIGLSSIFFLEHADDVRVIAIEPEPTNCSLFRRNAASGRATLYEGAVSAHAGEAQLQVRGPTSHALVPKGDKNAVMLRVRAYTLDDLAERETLDHVDILKVDIEGTEHFLFEHRIALLANTDRILIEIHAEEDRPRIVKLLAEEGFRHIPPAHPGRPDRFERR